MTTQKDLNDLIKQVSVLTGIANNKEDAIKNGQKAYLALDYAAVYGGARLVMVQVKNGAQYGAFNWGSTCPRLKPSVFAEKLIGLITGLEYTKSVYYKMVK